ncbi:hypothetical protein DSM07_04910 [Oenococcus sp. UCMA 16435]|nr:hypothetical protein DSM07_04910 [Oenococcus sp. UCMA 16435]MDI4583884.1 hypothetical protein [Oenococcus sp. UCMA 14587]
MGIETYKDIFKSINGRVYLEQLPHLEKICSGQSFLYRKNGSESMVMELSMHDLVDADLLEKAFLQSLSRYPYLTSKFIKVDGDFYLSANYLPMKFAETPRLRSLGSLETNYHLIDITFFEKKIYVAYHHGLCDGRGIMPFIRNLIYYYCLKKYQPAIDIDDSGLVSENMSIGELQEPFVSEKKATETLLVFKHDAFRLPELAANKYLDKSTRYELNIDQDSFVRWARSKHATPSIAVALLMSKAIKNVHPNEKEIICNLASDDRAGSSCQNTFRNCVGNIELAYSRHLDEIPFLDQVENYRNTIRQNKQKQQLKDSISRMTALSNQLDKRKGFLAKQKMLSFYDDLILDTFVLSYIGQFKLGAYESFIDNIHSYISGSKSLTIQMSAVNKTLSLDFIQSFADKVYLESFVEELKQRNIDFSVNGPIEFETPYDALKQSEFIKEA